MIQRGDHLDLSKDLLMLTQKSIGLCSRGLENIQQALFLYSNCYPLEPLKCLIKANKSLYILFINI